MLSQGTTFQKGPNSNLDDTSVTHPTEWDGCPLPHAL